MTAISGSFTAPTTGTNNFRWSNDDAGGMYVDLNGDGKFSSFESVAAWDWDGNGDLSLVAGISYNFFYMTAEGGGGDTNNWYITQPSGSEERVNFGKPSQISMWSAPALDNLIISTGTPANIEIPADRNPTSWSATGLPSGLSINNSGVITGSASALGSFTATIIAINADGDVVSCFEGPGPLGAFHFDSLT